MPAREICPSALARAFRHGAIAYILFALLAVLFVAPFLWFRGMRQPVIDAGPLLALAACGLGVALVAISRLFPARCQATPLQRKRFRLMTAAVAVVLFAVQLALLKGGFFITDWDAGQLAMTAFDPSSLTTDAGTNEYYSRNGNQVFLMGVFAALSQVAKAFGATSFAASYFVMAAGGCACLAISTALIACVVERIGGVRAGALALAVAIALCGLSPWLFVPYSDSYGMLSTTVVLFAYACVRRSVPRTAMIGFFSAVGYFIKPTAIFVCAAIVFVEACSALARRRAAKRSACTTDAAAEAGQAGGCDRCARPDAGQKDEQGLRVKDFVMRTALPFVLAVAAAFAVSALVTGPYKGSLDESKGFSATHFLMLGANVESNGRWTPEEYAISAGVEDPEERKAVNLSVWRERMKEMGVSGALSLAVKKTVNTYLDGSFWWEGEGVFYQEVLGQNAAVKDFYNIGYEKNWESDGAGNPTPYFHLAQVAWLFVLIGCVLSWCVRRPTNVECVVALSLLALSAFLVVFECRARYLFLYAPYFVALAAWGWQGAAHCARGRLARRGEKRPRGVRYGRRA